MKDLCEKASSLLALNRAPSQFSILVYLVSTGRSLTIKELSEGLSLTYKATERAVAKLLEKGLIQRLPFKGGTYTCDTKQLLLCLLLVCSEMDAQLKKQTKS